MFSLPKSNIPVVAAIRCSLMFLVSAVAAVLTHLSALAQCTTNEFPHITGTWTVLPYQMPINPISAHLLPNGKVLIVAGSENDASNNSKGAESYRAAVWDPTGTNESSISVQNLTYDVFCSGTAALFDGRSLIVGGTSDYSFTGENRASIFNPATSQYVQSQNMVVGMRQRRPLPMVALWPCPGSLKPGVQVKPSRFMISKMQERVGINCLRAFPSPPRFTQGLSCYPVGECFIPDTAVEGRMQMHGCSTRRLEAGRHQPRSL